MKSKEILDKIKALFNVESVEEKQVEVVEPTVLAEEIPTDEPKSEEEMPTDEVKIEDEVKQLEDKIKEIENLLGIKDEEMKSKTEEIETLSKQIVEKDEKIKSMEIELSKTPQSEPIQIEKNAKKANFSNVMYETIKKSRQEKGLDY